MTRETEWDDEQVGRMLALRQVKAALCSCGCGLPRVVAHNEKSDFATQPVICHARKWLTVAQRDAEQNRLPAKDRDPKWSEGKPQPGDGELWTVFEHNPTANDFPEVDRRD